MGAGQNQLSIPRGSPQKQPTPPYGFDVPAMSVSVANSTSENAACQKFNLILLRGSNSEILLSHRNGSFALPELTIPIGQRFARCINERVLEKWNLQTICLFQSEAHYRVEDESENQYVVLEPRDPYGQPPADFSWTSRDRLSNSLESASEVGALQAILQRADAYNEGTQPGPFARCGWFDELLSWAQGQVSSHKLNLTGKFRQLNCSPFFSLVKLQTTGPGLWFKAVGEPNLHEYSITLGLAHDHPRYFPKILGAKPEWNGWLMLESEGKRFDSSSQLDRWQHVAKTFAHLQLECLGQTQRLLEIGCKDRRIAMIIPRIDTFIETMGRLMEQQPSEPPPRLSYLELKELGSKLKSACDRMQLAGLPNSLLHGDFSPGNVRVGTDNCIFLDWAEGYLGPPFLTLEYLIAYLYRADMGSSESEQNLRRAYANCWLEVASEEQIFETMKLVPSIAAFSYALSSADWQTPQRLQETGVAKHLRSLTRRIHRELERLKSQELCLG